MSSSDAPYPRWNPDGELGQALLAAAEHLEHNGLRLAGAFQLGDMTRRQRAAIGALLGCGMVRPRVTLDIEVLDSIFRGKYGLGAGLVQACETTLGRTLVDSAGH